MSDALGTAIVEILGDASGLNSEIDKLKKTLPASVLGLGTAITAAFTAASAAVTATVIETAEYADQMGKAAQKTGIGIEKLAGLRQLAAQNDLSFQDLQGSLRIFSTHVKGDMLTALTQVGAKFAKMPDDVEKVKLATELFGRSGQRLIPMLNEFSAGLAKSQAEAQAFGLVIGPDLAKAGDDLGDNLANVGKIGKGLGITFGSVLVPEAVKITHQFVEWYKANGDLIKQDVGTWATRLGGVLSTLTPIVTKAATGISHYLGVVWDSFALTAAAFHKENVKIGDLAIERAKHVGEEEKKATTVTTAAQEEALKKRAAALAKFLDEEVKKWKEAEGKKQEALSNGIAREVKIVADGMKLEQDARNKAFESYAEFVSIGTTTELQALEIKYQEELALAERFGFDKEKIELAYLKRKEVLETAYDRRAAARQAADYKQRMDSTTALLQGVAGLFGALAAAQDTTSKAGFERNKKLQIAEAIIATLAGSVQAYTSQVGIPYVGPYLAVIAAAAALVAGYANVAKIRKTTWQGGQAAGGIDNLPEDQTILAHRGEMIVPANPAEKIRGFADALASGGVNRGTTADGKQVVIRFEGNDRAFAKALLRMLTIEVRDGDGELIATGLKGTARGI